MLDHERQAKPQTLQAATGEKKPKTSKKDKEAKSAKKAKKEVPLAQLKRKLEPSDWMTPLLVVIGYPILVL